MFPDPPIPIYLAGTRMIAVYPLVATIGAAVNVTMVTYDGKAFIGVSTDDRAITDHADLMQDLRAGFHAADPVGRYSLRGTKIRGDCEFFTGKFERKRIHARAGNRSRAHPLRCSCD